MAPNSNSLIHLGIAKVWKLNTGKAFEWWVL